jgi:hypothetical protein
VTSRKVWVFQYSCVRDLELMKYNVLDTTVVSSGEETCQRMKRHGLKMFTELKIEKFCISVYCFFPPTNDGPKIRQHAVPRVN